MMIDNLKFTGKSKRKNFVKSLLEFYAESKGISALPTDTVLMLDVLCDDLSEVKTAVYPLELFTQEQKQLCEKNGVKAVTYSLGDMSADLVAFNRQEREANISYELMAQSKLARIFIARDKDYVIDDVLPSAAVLFASGEELTDIVSTFNSLLY